LHETIYGLNLAFCFCNLRARVNKVSPLCSRGSAFGCESTEPPLTCLINLFSESLGALCLSHPIIFLGAHVQDLELVSSPPCHQDLAPPACWERIHQAPVGLLIQWRDLPLLACWKASLSCTKEPGEGSGTNWESCLSGWLRTPIQIIGLPLAEGEPDHLSKTPE
jgi:hypothetical protein